MALNNKVAVVTGGNRGLGHELCKQLGRAGYTVILTARGLASAQQAAATFPEELQIHPLALDVSDPQDADDFAKRLRLVHVEQVDLLINNAGINIDHPNLTPGEGNPPSLFATSIATFLTTFQTNVLGAYSVSKSLAPLLRKAPKARIINVSSGMGQLSTIGPGYPAYRISKTALNSLTKLLAAEFSGDRITVNSVCPGWVRTEMGGPNAELSTEDAVKNILWLLENTDDKTGLFFQNKKQIDW